MIRQFTSVKVAAIFLAVAGANLRAEPPAAEAPPAEVKQSVTVELTVVEVNRTKLRALGFDWDLLAGGKPSSVADLMDFKVGSDKWNGFLKVLRQYDLAIVLSEPQIITLSGRPAHISIGEGAVKLDVVPIVLGSGRIQVEHRWQFSHSGRELKSESTVEVDSGQAVIANKMRREQKDADGKVSEIETLVILRATSSAADKQAAGAATATPSTRSASQQPAATYKDVELKPTRR